MAITDDQLGTLNAYARILGRREAGRIGGLGRTRNVTDFRIVDDVIAYGADRGMRTEDEHDAPLTIEDLPDAQDRRELAAAFRLAAEQRKYVDPKIVWATGHEPYVKADVRPYGQDRFAAVKLGKVPVAAVVMLDVDLEMEILGGATPDGTTITNEQVAWLNVDNDTRRLWCVQAAVYANGDQDDSLGGICASSPADALEQYLARHFLPDVPRIPPLDTPRTTETPA